MKKMTAFFAVFFIIATAFSFAAGKNTTSSNKSYDKKSIVCATFPEYDWVLNILGSKISDFEVTLLQDKGADLHSYQPTIKDIAKISTCNLFIYVGGESNNWVEKAIANSTNKNQIVINIMEVLGDKIREEEIVEGMQEEESNEESEYDEHVWLSLRNAAIISKKLSLAIEKIDSNNAAVYESNAEAYIKQLLELDKNIEKTVAASKSKTILFGDRFPFRYFTDDYGISYYAAFAGCSAETEASFETIAFLSKKVAELGLKTIITIEKSDKKLANSIAKNSKIKGISIVEMDSLQSVTAMEIKNGKTYLSTMKENHNALKQALN